MDATLKRYTSVHNLNKQSNNSHTVAIESKKLNSIKENL